MIPIPDNIKLAEQNVPFVPRVMENIEIQISCAAHA
jgi:hypothetical protein